MQAVQWAWISSEESMTTLKLWAWRALAFVVLMALLPTFLIMGDVADWRETWHKAMEEA